MIRKDNLYFSKQKVPADWELCVHFDIPNINKNCKRQVVYIKISTSIFFTIPPTFGICLNIFDLIKKVK